MIKGGGDGKGGEDILNYLMDDGTKGAIELILEEIAEIKEAEGKGEISGDISMMLIDLLERDIGYLIEGPF